MEVLSTAPKENPAFGKRFFSSPITTAAEHRERTALTAYEATCPAYDTAVTAYDAALIAYEEASRKIAMDDSINAHCDRAEGFTNALVTLEETRIVYEYTRDVRREAMASLLSSRNVIKATILRIANTRATIGTIDMASLYN